MVRIDPPPPGGKSRREALPQYRTQSWPARLHFVRSKHDSKLWVRDGLELRMIDWRTWRLSNPDGTLRAMLASVKRTEAKVTEDLTRRLLAAMEGVS